VLAREWHVCETISVQGAVLSALFRFEFILEKEGKKKKFFVSTNVKNSGLRYLAEVLSKSYKSHSESYSGAKSFSEIIK